MLICPDPLSQFKIVGATDHIFQKYIYFFSLNIPFQTVFACCCPLGPTGTPGPTKPYYLFPDLDAGFIPASSASPSYHVALFVLSSPENFKRRNKLRKLWLEGITLQFLFLIGHSNDITVEMLLEEVLVHTSNLIGMAAIFLLLGQKKTK